MKRPKYSGCTLTLVVLFLALGAQSLMAQTPIRRPVPLLGQVTRPAPPVKNGTTATQTPRTKNGTATKQKPCWQEAGISQAALNERRSIQQSVRAQVEAVCSQSGLTDQERRQKIAEIHKAAQQQVAGLITPQQQEALNACNRARAGNAVPHPHVPGGGPHLGGGPCAQFGH